MAGTLKSASGKSKINLSKKKFGIVVAEWNEEITEALYRGAYDALIQLGVSKKSIHRSNVPGSFELPLAALWMVEKKKVDGGDLPRLRHSRRHAPFHIYLRCSRQRHYEGKSKHTKASSIWRIDDTQ